MVAAFHSAGHRVRAAPDGQAGLAHFMAEAADLVVTDIIMPNREGIETIVELRKASLSVKIIAISGGYRVGPDDFLQLARQVGADGALAKPFRPSELVGLARTLLGTRAAAVAA
jgi:DNA-binding response OmpR family regulator